MWPVAVGPFVCLQDKKISSSCIYFFPFVFCPLYVGPVFGEDAKKILRRRHTKYKKKLLTYKILHTKNSSAKMQKKILPIVFIFFPLYFGHLRRVYTVAFVCCICILPIVCFPFVCCPCILYVARCMLAFYHTFVFFFLPFCVLAFYHTFVFFFFCPFVWASVRCPAV
jgi:hypothetical protein